MALLLVIPVLAVSLIAVGFVYQLLGARRDRLRYATDGRFIDIGNGQRLYLLEKGSSGPTVLFEAGIAATNLNWFRVQKAVAQFATTASYDRCGLGWSTKCLTARTPANIVAELHCMLDKAGIKPPYVLVGHSFGGLVMRRFALAYPGEVASMVLVDPMRCEEWPPLSPGKQAEIDRGKKLSSFAIPAARVGLVRIAITTLFGRSCRAAEQLANAAGEGGCHVLKRVKQEVGKMPREIWPSIAAHWSRPGYYAGMRSHVEAVPRTVIEMKDAEPIRDIPVLVLTPGNSTPLSPEHLLRIGNSVQQVIASKSAHWIHLDQPELVIDSIRQMANLAVNEPVAAAGD